MLKFLIADDYQVVRIGLKQILSENFPDALIEEASDTNALIQKSATGKWSIIIADLIMPGGGGVDTLRKIKEASGNSPILVVSVYPEEKYAFYVIKAGADGFLNKNAPPEELVNAVKQILSGKKYNSATIK